MSDGKECYCQSGWKCPNCVAYLERLLHLISCEHGFPAGLGLDRYTMGAMVALMEKVLARNENLLALIDKYFEEVRR